jgi:uncharacterized protein with von Willebrand factor type A (vWA) domain
VLRFAEHFPGGGTDFARALDAGIERLAERPLRGADLVLITDGECRVEPEWRERYLAARRRLGFRLYAVLVDQGAHDIEGVAPLADRITTVSRLTPRSVRDLFLTI